MTTPTFVERLPHEAGFGRVFAREIAPKLGGIERERRRALVQVVLRAALTAGFFAAIIAVQLKMLVPAPYHFAVMPLLAMFGLIGGGLWAYLPYRRYKGALREVLVGPVCRFLGGLAYTREPRWDEGLARCDKLGLIPWYGAARLEDMFEGAHRGLGYRLVEGRLYRGRRRSRRKVFQGLLCEIALPAAFEGRLLIRADRSLLGAALAWTTGRLRGLTRTRLDDGRFERRFRVYAERPEAARRPLTAAVRAALLDLTEGDGARRFGRNGLVAAFAEAHFVLALPARRNLFDAGSLLRSADRSERDIRNIMLDLLLPRRLIDALADAAPRADADR